MEVLFSIDTEIHLVDEARKVFFFFFFDLQHRQESSRRYTNEIFFILFFSSGTTTRAECLILRLQASTGINKRLGVSRSLYEER